MYSEFVNGVGCQSVKLAAGVSVHLLCSGSVGVFLVPSGQLIVSGVTHRGFYFDLPEDCDTFDIVCGDCFRWSYRWCSISLPYEVPDPTPIAIPLGAHRPLTLREEMQRMIRSELLRSQVNQSAGTFEEEDDFSDDEDVPNLSEFEMTEDHEAAREEAVNEPDDGAVEPSREAGKNFRDRNTPTDNKGKRRGRKEDGYQRDDDRSDNSDERASNSEAGRVSSRRGSNPAANDEGDENA